jgi:hypothetical protein
MRVFYAYDGNGDELTVDTADVEINPSGYGIKVKTYPTKRFGKGDRKGIYQNYKVIAGHIPEEKRDDFLQVCKKLMSNFRKKEKEKEKGKKKLRAIVKKIKI